MQTGKCTTDFIRCDLVVQPCGSLVVNTLNCQRKGDIISAKGEGLRFLIYTQLQKTQLQNVHYWWEVQLVMDKSGYPVLHAKTKASLTLHTHDGLLGVGSQDCWFSCITDLDLTLSGTCIRNLIHYDLVIIQPRYSILFNLDVKLVS